MSASPASAVPPTPQSREVLSWLEMQGYRPSVDDDGDLRIVMFGRRYLITHQGDDDTYYRLAAHLIHTFDDVGRDDAWAAALEITASTKVARCIVHGNHVSVIADGRHIEPAHFVAVFEDLIGAVDHAVAPSEQHWMSTLPAIAPKRSSRRPGPGNDHAIAGILAAGRLLHSRRKGVAPSPEGSRVVIAEYKSDPSAADRCIGDSPSRADRPRPLPAQPPKRYTDRRMIA